MFAGRKVEHIYESLSIDERTFPKRLNYSGNLVKDTLK